MKNKIILVYSMCMLLLTGCSVPLSALRNDDGADNQNEGTNNADFSDGIIVSEGSDSFNEGDEVSSSSVSYDSQNKANNIPWKSPLADYVPVSPFPSYLRFINGEITTWRDGKYFADYLSDGFKYTCCDLSGDGVDELVILFSDEDGERLLVFSYDSENKAVYESINCKYNSECDSISKNGFVLINAYKDSDGNNYSGKTDDKTCTQWIYVEMVDVTMHDHQMLALFEREAGSSDYIEYEMGFSKEDLDQIIDMASDKVELYDANDIKDIISYLEKCSDSFEESFDEYKLYKQQGNGIFHNLNISEVPDVEYQEDEAAYDAFINGDTCVRCDYGIKVYEASSAYIYGDKFILSDWYYPNEYYSLDTHYIDCGSDGSKELLIDVTSTLNSETVDYLYVISFFEGHLYLRFVAESSSRSSVDIGDNGYILSGGSSSENASGESGAFLDADVFFQEIYDIDMVSSYELKDYFPEAYEMAPAGDCTTIYICRIDGEEYYIPYIYEEITDEEDYTDFMNACVECGITFSSQEEVDALIEAKKAEYGF